MTSIAYDKSTECKATVIEIDGQEKRNIRLGKDARKKRPRTCQSGR